MSYELYRTTPRVDEEHIERHLDDALTKGRGLLEAHAAWGPRLFNQPGKNQELVAEDYFPEGPNGPVINERWIGMPQPADTGVEKLVSAMDRMTLTHLYGADGKML